MPGIPKWVGVLVLDLPGISSPMQTKINAVPCFTIPINGEDGGHGEALGGIIRGCWLLAIYVAVLVEHSKGALLVGLIGTVLSLKKRFS